MLNYLILNLNRKPLIISIFLGIIDNLLKAYIRSNNFEDLVIIENVLEIDLNYNTGIAFGFLKNQAPFTFIVSSVVLVWLIFQFKNEFNKKIEEYAFILVLGGAFGNLGERFVNLINGKLISGHSSSSTFHVLQSKIKRITKNNKLEVRYTGLPKK